MPRLHLHPTYAPSKQALGFLGSSVGRLLLVRSEELAGESSAVPVQNWRSLAMSENHPSKQCLSERKRKFLESQD